MAKKTIRQTVCPMCGWLRNVFRKDATQKIFRYGFVPIDPEKFSILRWVVSLGHPTDGRKAGFDTVGRMTFKQAYADPRTRDIVNDVRARAVRILQVIDQVIAEVERGA